MATELPSPTPPAGWTGIWRDWHQEGFEPTVVLWFISPTGDEVLSLFSQIQAAEYIDLNAFHGG